ncbi:MAG: hypothetical protein HYT87_03435 [Nitrospirae bacterium]|nr:hypothetical protein [Nitrospirota bacterium]
MALSWTAHACRLFTTVTFVLGLGPIREARSTPLPGVERSFGITTVNAVSGNGGLSVGISKRGELVVLKWPSPSYFDHLNYRTPMPGLEEIEDYDENYGAEELWGSFAGLKVHTSGGETLTWLRDAHWTRAQRYFSSDTPIIITEYRNNSLGLTVTGTDFVKPDDDVLIRSYRIDRDPDSAATGAQLIYLANMAPCTSKVTFLPTKCWTEDELEGYATVYDEGGGRFVSFKPANRDFSKLPSNDAASIKRFLDQADIMFHPATSAGPYNLLHTEDVWWTLGSSKKPSGHLLFEDWEASVVPFDATPNDTYVVTGPAALGLLYDVDSTSPEITLVFAVAGKASDSLGLWSRAVGQSVLSQRDVTQKWWEKWLSRAALPNTSDEKILSVSKRALISLKIATDRESGAMVASITNQPPYGEDWPRDGAFFNHTLDLAGYPEMVEKHNEFYVRVIRKRDGQDRFGTNQAPAGSFAMNYYADGRPGGIFDFEIDEAGFGLWTLAAHSDFLSGTQQKAYLDKVYPTIQVAADLLTACRDASNGLQCPAEEDDNPGNFQTIHGATAVLAGLKAAVRVAPIMGEDAARLASWQNRVTELEQAIAREFYKTDGGHFGGGTGAGAWLIWPTEFLPFDDPRMRSHSDYVFNEMLPFFQKKGDGAYLGKATAALALLWKDDAERGAKLEPVIRTLLTEVPTPDTEHYGEVFVVRDVDGNGSLDYEMHVAQPHVWEATLSYLTAAFFYGLVPGKPQGHAESTSSCACQSIGTGARLSLPGLLPYSFILLFPLMARRKARIHRS